MTILPLLAVLVQILGGERIDALQAPPNTKAIVYLFTSTDCPVSNRYAPEVRRLEQTFAAKGVRFRLVYPSHFESDAAVRDHMALFAYGSLEAVRDPSLALVRFTGATITPEAVVIMTPGPEELGVVRQQFARFASQCRVFAPMYRQFTLTALRAAATGTPLQADRALGYNDIKDAWNYYLQHDNNGRGVVLVGHSQGSGVLTQLIREEIDGKPAQSRLVSALLMGTNLAVPKGKDVGGAFKSVPVCRSASQTGCAIAYVSFRSTIPPPENSRFGRVQGENMMAACANPAALAGGSGELHAYLASGGRSIVGSAAEPKPWVNPPKPIDTPFVSVPGLLTAQCVDNAKGSYLEITVHGDPADPRVDDISGDVMTNGQVNATWGLHLIDVNEAMGNLLDIVAQQARAFTTVKKSQ